MLAIPSACVHGHMPTPPVTGDSPEPDAAPHALASLGAPSPERDDTASLAPGISLLPSELLAYIGGFLPLDAVQAFGGTCRRVHLALAPQAVEGRLEWRARRIATPSTLHAALAQLEHPALSEARRARWLGRLAARLESFPTSLTAAGAHAVLDLLETLPPEHRCEPLIGLMLGMTYMESLEHNDGCRDVILARIMALPPELRAGPLTHFLDLLPVGELTEAETEAWIGHASTLPAQGRGAILSKILGNLSMYGNDWWCRAYSRVLDVTAELPGLEQVPVLRMLAGRLGQRLQTYAGQSCQEAVACWKRVLDAAALLPGPAASAVLNRLARHMRPAAAEEDDCWRALWSCATVTPLTPEQVGSWLANMARSPCMASDSPRRWADVLDLSQRLPAAQRAQVWERLADGLDMLADNHTRQQRWQYLIGLAPTLESHGRARLLAALAGSLQRKASADDEQRWTALLDCAESLDPLDAALVLVQCMDDADSAEGLWGAHLRKHAALSPQERAQALEALASKLKFLPDAGRRVGACSDALKAIATLPVSLQQRPALAWAGAIMKLIGEANHLSGLLGTVLSQWSDEQRLQWLLECSALIGDLDEARWVVRMLSGLPKWMRAPVIAEVAQWAAGDDGGADADALPLSIDLAVAALTVPPQHRGVIVPAMQRLYEAMSDVSPAAMRHVLAAICRDVPACDLPDSASYRDVSGDDEDESRGVKRGYAQMLAPDDAL